MPVGIGHSFRNGSTSVLLSDVYSSQLVYLQQSQDCRCRSDIPGAQIQWPITELATSWVGENGQV